MTDAKAVGLFGGTFDPVHNGHLRAAEEVLKLAPLDRILFIPSYRPPHKTAATAASAEDRLRMVELACAGRPGFEPSAIEVEARETSYSIVTLGKVRARFPSARLFFILGIDAFLEIGTWREHERVVAECSFLVLGRPGFDLKRAWGVLEGRLAGRTVRLAPEEGPVRALPAGPRVFLVPIQALDVSSTAIRERLARGETVRGLVPDAVEAYIRDRRLYRRE